MGYPVFDYRNKPKGHRCSNVNEWYWIIIETFIWESIRRWCTSTIIPVPDLYLRRYWHCQHTIQYNSNWCCYQFTNHCIHPRRRTLSGEAQGARQAIRASSSAIVQKVTTHDLDQQQWCGWYISSNLRRSWEEWESHGILTGTVFFKPNIKLYIQEFANVASVWPLASWFLYPMDYL